MSVTPRGESVRRAIRYVSDQLREDAERPLMPIVNEAILRFDLSPSEGEYLIRFYREAERDAKR